MKRSKITPIDESRDFQIDEVFFSTTDTNGRIVSGNDVFVRISGYCYEEIIGKPHSIIRHPDMPRVVFKLLWDYLQNGKSVVAFVKNMAKDGRYYWVLALVQPIDGGHISVRIKPTSALLSTIATLYTELLTLEQKIEARDDGTKEEAMAASKSLLLTRLNELGFSSYDEFMRVAMLMETRSRGVALRTKNSSLITGGGYGTGANNVQALFSSCRRTESAVSILFDHMDQVASVEQAITSTEEFFCDFSGTIKLLSLNASIESKKLGHSAKGISIVADWLSSSSQLALSETASISRVFHRVNDDVREALFKLACAKLQVEVMGHFTWSLGVHNESLPTETYSGTMKLVELLFNVMNGAISDALETLNALPSASADLLSGMGTIRQQEQKLRFLHVAGIVEIARLPSNNSLKSVFDKVAALIDRTNQEMKTLQHAVGVMQNTISMAAPQQESVMSAVVEVERDYHDTVKTVEALSAAT